MVLAPTIISSGRKVMLAVGALASSPAPALGTNCCCACTGGVTALTINATERAMPSRGPLRPTEPLHKAMSQCPLGSGFQRPTHPSAAFSINHESIPESSARNHRGGAHRKAKFPEHAAVGGASPRRYHAHPAGSPWSIMIRITTSSLALFLLAAALPARADMASAVAAYNAGEFSAAYRELYPLAVQENPQAAYLVARMNLAGQGVPQNTQEGLKWLRMAASHDEVEAQVQLGMRYELGLGVTQDDAEAFRWYKRAAELGSPVAQLNLGVVYSNGRGVAADLVVSHMWLNLATAALPPGQIRSSAAKLRDSVTARLTPEEVIMAHEMARAWKPVAP